MSKVICISREYGSGGHEIATKVAERLNIPCIDKEMMEQIMIDSDLPEKMLVAADEKRKSPLRYTSVYEGKYKEFYGMAPNDILFELQKRYIREEAEKGDCVIVGRCAEEILKDMHHLVVNIFITAPVEWRVRRKMEEAGTQDRKRIEKEIKKVDKHRLSYYEYHTGKDWGIPHNYDVCLNSASMGIDRIVNLITESFETIDREADKRE